MLINLNKELEQSGVRLGGPNLVYSEALLYLISMVKHLFGGQPNLPCHLLLALLHFVGLYPTQPTGLVVCTQ